MPPSPAADPLRTWTSHDQAPSGKWIFVFWLGLTLLILLATFFWWLNLPSPPKTFYVSMVIEDYGDLLPKPYYPVWSSAKIAKLQTKRDIEQWTTFEEDYLQSFDNLETALYELPAKLTKRDANNQDTLILQLRMHCKVTPGEDGQLNLGLLPGEKGSELSADNLVQALQKVPAKNVLVLADICDLDYAPQIGVIVNPIASSLQQLCKRTKTQSGPNIWILCAGRDLDSNYISHLRQRTLLQSACESALAKESNQGSQASDNTISLAEFYRQVWAYCRRATEFPSANLNSPGPPNQLPLLMRVGDGSLCEFSETPSDSWNLATQVHVARFLSSRKKSSSEEDEKPKKESTEDASANVAKSKAETNDPVLNFWKLRDGLTTSASWSPALFAPHHWQEYQQQIARRQFDGNASDAIKKDLQVLQKLFDEIKSPSNSTDIDTSQPLLKSFRDFLRDPTFDAARQTWQRNDLIVQSADEWELWKAKYRKYAEACSNIPAWAHWYRHELTRYERDLRNFEDLASALLELHSALPKDNRGILDQNATFDTTKLDKCVLDLRRLLADQCGKLDKCFQKKKPKLSWHEEHQLQRLIESPLLDSDLRQDLWLKWRGLYADADPLDHAVEPDESYQQTNSNEKHNADTGRFDSAITKWVDVVGKLGQLANVTGGNLQTNWNDLKDSKELSWMQFGEEVYRSSPTSSHAQDKRLHEWHIRCLSGLLPSRPEANFSAGIVLPASLSRALQVSITPKGTIRFGEKAETEVTLLAQFRDTTPISEVWISWRLQNALGNNADRFLTIANAGVPISSDINDPTRIKVNSDRTINLKLTSHELSQSLKAPLPVEFLVCEKRSATPIKLAVSVVPTQPNQVDLYVQRAIGQQVNNIESDTPDGYLALDCVAAQGAKSLFRFGLINRSGQAKTCVVTLHPLPLSLMKSGPPDASSLRDVRKKWPAIGKATVNLPAGEVGNDQPTPLELTSVKAEPVVPTPEYGWFYFHIQEIDADGKEKPKSHAAYCRLEGVNPILAKLLDIAPSITKQGYKMFIKPNQTAWQEHGLETLQVKTDVYTAEGKFIREQSRITLMGGFGQEVTCQLDSAAVLHFYLSVGGYPRAATYASDDVLPSVPSIAQIKSVQAFTSGPNSRVVPPNKDGVFPAIEPPEQIINYAGIRLTAQIDVRNYSIRLVNSNNGSITAPSSATRRMDFKWEVLESGGIAMEVAASDIEATIPLDSPNGRYNLQIELPDGRLLSKDRPPVIFDQDKPEQIEYYFRGSRVRLENGIDIRDGEELIFEATARDRGSGIGRLEFAINSPANIQPIFDDQDTKLTSLEKSDTAKDTWRCKVKPAEYTGLGTFTIVARSEDFAMNVEKSHPALKVHVKRASKPPKSDDKAK